MSSAPPPDRRPLIVTAWIDPDDLRPFSRLRTRFFPAERNYLDAHLTLFHHIEPDDRQAFMDYARECLADVPAFTAEVLPPFALGGGVAYGVEAKGMRALRQPLRDAFRNRLTAQDARPWKRPHLTVQNKVDPATADRLLRHLTHHFTPCRLRIRGLSFYRYDGGPWHELGNLALRD